MSRACEHCDRPLPPRKPWPRSGRLRRWCSVACKSKQYRLRQSAPPAAWARQVISEDVPCEAGRPAEPEPERQAMRRAPATFCTPLPA